MSDKRQNVRLPKNVRPSHYEIDFVPDLENFTFGGRAAINVEVLERTDTITLHALDLTIRSATFYAGKICVASSKLEFNKKRQTVSLKFNQVIEPGEGRLFVNFSGELNDKMCGFYRSSYEVDGEKRWMASTQFEATDARRAFPCWDEPEIKASFGVSFIVPTRLRVLSNMPVLSEDDIFGALKKLVVFKVTPPMSTYALAFVVGELESVETKTKSGLPINVWTTPGKVEQGRFALDVCEKSIEFFEEYLGAPYPLPKLDLVAVPDFAAGAMENWGLVTYRETALLYDPKNSSASAKQRVAQVVIHENTHMWFGDLVTMKWWNDLWLNEGFASFLEPKCTDYLFPEWDIWTQFVAEEYAAALSEDGLKNTHPIEVEVNDPAEIHEIFDAISYSKGACIIRMLAEYLGEEIFRKCLKSYLIRFAYKTASTGELYGVFEEVSGRPVKEFMDCWTKQAGYPLVSVEWTPTDGKVSLFQKRFLSSGEDLDFEETKKRWSVPLEMWLGSEEPGRKYARNFTLNSMLDDAGVFLGEKNWLIVNAGQKAFCRTHYCEPEILRNLAGPIKDGLLNPVDRLGVISDLFYNALAGNTPTTELLSLLPAYKNEKNHAVWGEILSILSSLGKRLHGKDIATTCAFAGWSSVLMFGIASHLGWEPKEAEAHTDKLLRSQVLSAFANITEDDKTISEAQKRFDRSGIDPDLKDAVYGIVAAHGNYYPEYVNLLHCYRAARLSEEKTRILRALGKFRNPEIVGEALKFSLSEEVRPQDTIFVFMSAGANPAVNFVAWKFLKDNWKKLNKRYSGGGLFMMQGIIGGTIGGFDSFGMADEIEKFFAKHPAPEAKRTIQQALERIRIRARWLERDYEKIKEFFSK